jgi:FAD/FMN-containing dehydrogenase
MTMGEKKDELAKIVGSENVWDDPELLDEYSKDQSLVPPRRPRLVVKPLKAEEVQAIVQWANQTGTALVPISSGPPHFRGDTVPSAGGAVIVDLSRMKQILRIDRRNRVVMIEPGVTFGQLQSELAREGMRLSLPLLPRSNKSVVASLLEREPILIPKYQWTLLEPLRCAEVVWGDGSKLWTGDAGPWGSLERQWDMKHAQVMPLGWGQADYYRFVSGAQGTMGIVTWATLKCEVLPRVHNIFFAASERLESLFGLAQKLLRIRYADEFLFLNSQNLASILAEEADRIKALKEELPPWVLLLGVAGRERLPEAKVEYQKRDMTEMAQQLGLKLTTAVPGARDREVIEALTNPCKDPYWKLRYKGGCQDIFFLSTLDKIPLFVETMVRVSQAHHYSPSDLGVYIQPVNRGVGVHCEFNLPYDPGSARESAKVQGLFREASEALISQNAFFSRPYGGWAEMAYNRDAQATIVLRQVKQIFDPKNVMNPGKLCF